MSILAQGFIEVTGFVAAIEAADAMAKAADVTVRRVHKVDGPCVCVICEGDVAACQAAVDAAVNICSAKGTVLIKNIIPHPAEGEELHKCLDAINAVKAAKKLAKQKATAARAKARAKADK